jgi:hypothetical protein
MLQRRWKDSVESRRDGMPCPTLEVPSSVFEAYPIDL